MSDFMDIDDLEDMVKRIGADRLTQQAGLMQNLIALKMPSEEDYDAPPAKMRTARPIEVERARGIDIVNVMNGTPGNLGVVSTGGARNPTSTSKAFSGKKKPNTLAGSLFFSTDEYEMAQGEQAVDRVLKVMDAAGSGAGKYIARSFVNPEVAPPNAAAAAGATSFFVDVFNGYWPGQTYEVERGGAVVAVLRFMNVKPEFDGSAELILDTDDHPAGLSIALATTDQIYLLGQSDATKRLGSIADATDDTLDLYDIDQNRMPAGMLHSVGAQFGHEDGRRLCSMVHTMSSEWPTHWLGSPVGIDGVVNDQVDNVRFVAGESDVGMDPYFDAQAPYFNGLPCIKEPVYNDDVLDLINANHLKMREYWAYRPRASNGSAKQGTGRDVLLVDRDRVGAIALFDGAFGTVFEKRSCHARLEDLQT